MGEYILEADGGSRGTTKGNPGLAGSGAVVLDLDGKILVEIGVFLGNATSNFAEYSGLVAGLKWLFEHDPDAAVTIKMDSKLVVEQMSGRWKIKHPNMQQKAMEAHSILSGKRFRFIWVPREQNLRADLLANKAMDAQTNFIHSYS